MKVYVDTSAFLAVLNADDNHHEMAKNTWLQLLHTKVNLVCSSYVLVETFSLVQNRLGINAVRSFQELVIPLINIFWVDESVHNLGVNSVLTANRKRLSLVDCTSFAVMRQAAIDKVFAFDKHFQEQGFQVIQPTSGMN